MEHRPIALVIIGCAWVGCATSPEPLDPIELEAVFPAEAMEGDVVDVRVVGRGFHLPLRADLDNDEIVSDVVTANLGSHPLADVVVQSETELVVTIPPNIPLGVYDLTVRFPDARQGSLSAAFVINRACNGFGQCETQDPCGQYQCIGGMCVRIRDFCR